MTLPIAKTCTGCGACCLQQESPPGYVAILNGLYDCDVDGPRIRALPQEARTELLDYIASRQRGEPHPNNGVCLWLDEETRQCRHYELRPEICREVVKVGDAACQQWRERYADEIVR